jgi:hypothetical protein
MRVLRRVHFIAYDSRVSVQRWKCRFSGCFGIPFTVPRRDSCDSCDVPYNDTGLGSDNAGARYRPTESNSFGIGNFPHLQSVANSKHVNAIIEVWQDYIHRVPVIMHDNLQRESCKRYVPRTAVKCLHLPRKVDEYLHFHLSDCRNTLTYAHTTSLILSTCDINLDSLTVPALKLENLWN